MSLVRMNSSYLFSAFHIDCGREPDQARPLTQDVTAEVQGQISRILPCEQGANQSIDSIDI